MHNTPIDVPIRIAGYNHIYRKENQSHLKRNKHHDRLLDFLVCLLFFSFFFHIFSFVIFNL